MTLRNRLMFLTFSKIGDHITLPRSASLAFLMLSLAMHEQGVLLNYLFLPHICKYTHINRYKFTGVIYDQIFSKLIDLRARARLD